MEELKLLDRLECDLGITSEVSNSRPHKKDLLNISSSLNEVSRVQPSKTKKNDLIEKIKLIAEKKYNPEEAEKIVKKATRKNKTELERDLGELIEGGLTECRGVSDSQIYNDTYNIEKSDDIPNIKDGTECYKTDNINCMDNMPTCSTPPVGINKPDVKPMNISVDTGAKSLYELNKMLSTILEKVSDSTLKPQTGYYIEGYTSKLEDKKEELLDLYREIYKEHASSISQYVSPLNMVVLINSQAVIGSIGKESKEIKKN